METAVNAPQSDAVRDLIAAGLIYGHKKTKTHPRMRDYVSAKKNEIDLLDPEAILKSLDKALVFIRGSAEKGGKPLYVGTQPAAQSAIKEAAAEADAPYVTHRWLGGTLTNFKALSQRIALYERLKKQIEEGDLKQYTKKEKMKIKGEFDKMDKNFSGLVNLKRLPDFVFVIDPSKHRTAVHEARLTSIPIVAVMDTDDDPDEIDYPIFGNDHARTSVNWVMEKVREAVKTAKSEIKNPEPE